MTGKYETADVGADGLDVTQMQADAVGYQGDEPPEVEDQEDA